MADLDLQALPPELQAALERAWPSCPEAQRRAVLAPHRLDGDSVWPSNLWPWQPAKRWWRPGLARECRAAEARFFASHVRDVRGADYGPLLFDPAQPFFPTPWTQATVLLRSPEPDVFSDADFWAISQLLFGGDGHWSVHTTKEWAHGMRTDGAVRGARRERWLADALWRLEMSATGAFS